MFLSAAMMLDWLGEQHAVDACTLAGRELKLAVERAFGDGTLIPVELGGTADTQAIFRRVHHELTRRSANARSIA
jgi:3-isopropylmalate dehydrogenase